MRNTETNNEIDNIWKWEEKITWKDLIYRANKYRYDFQQYETIRSFGENIYIGWRWGWRGLKQSIRKYGRIWK